MKNSRVDILSSVSITYAIRPNEDILWIRVEIEIYTGEFSDDFVYI